MPSWLAPPTRRELLLSLISLTVFVCAFNADTALHRLGYSMRLYSPFSGSVAPPIGPDGRRPEAYRDALEDEIFGTWDWEPGRIAGVKQTESLRVKGGNEDGDRYIYGDGLTGELALWLQGVGEGRYTADPRLGSTTINEEFIRWGQEVPRTKVVFHEPGFTILDNVTLAFGTFFLVTDNPESMPRVEALGSSLVNHTEPPRDIDWQVLPGHNSLPKLGTFGGWMHGTTLISYDSFADGHTLLSLQRLYSSLNTSAPPSRLILPAMHTFSDTRPSDDDGSVPRQRSSVGVHPATLKAAYPSIAGPHFSEDFDDFIGLGTPVLLSRIVVVDRGASARASMTDASWARIFASGPNDWFEPVRETLRAFFGVGEGKVPGKEITYLSRQVDGPVMPAADHEKLVKELRKLGAVVHVVDETTPWKDRMNAVVRSSVIIGGTGEHLSDSTFIVPGPHAALVELFPEGAFNQDWETVIRSMGHNYVAFQGSRKLDPNTLPALSRPSRLGELKIDPVAVARAVRDELARH